jgi:glycosyltransferase involved in cell wall biosynthesis
MEKYEIAVDARMISSSGIGTYLQHIIPAVCNKYKTALIGEKELLKAYDANVIEFTAPIYSIKEIVSLPSLIPKCSVFWSPHFNVPISATRAERLITTIHDVFHLAFLHTLNFKQKIYAKIFYNLAVRRSDRVITVSKFSKQEILRYIPIEPSKIEVIYNGVSKNEFSRAYSESLAQTIREKYNLPASYLLFVGNVKPHKNLVNLVYALEQILKKETNVYLVVVGKKDGFITGENKLTNILKLHPLLKERIIFTGFADKEDLPFIYQNAKLFLFPSIYEGFGLPPLEAMSAGTLTAVSDCASLPEVCKAGALYFNPHDKHAISHTIEHALLLSSEEETAIKKVANLILDQYDWSTTSQEHLNLFDEYIK